MLLLTQTETNKKKPFLFSCCKMLSVASRSSRLVVVCCGTASELETALSLEEMLWASRSLTSHPVVKHNTELESSHTACVKASAL